MSVPAHLSIPAPRPPTDDSPPAIGTVRTASVSGALSTLTEARTYWHNAERAVRTQDRYVIAYLAAVRAATAVLAARAARIGHRRPASVWRLLREAVPEFGDWALLFAAHSDRRVAVEAGIPAVSEADAEDLVLRAGEFVDVVGRSLSWAVR